MCTMKNVPLLIRVSGDLILLSISCCTRNPKEMDYLITATEHGHMSSPITPPHTRLSEKNLLKTHYFYSIKIKRSQCLLAQEDIL